MLDEILAYKKLEVQELKRKNSIQGLEKELYKFPIRDFVSPLTGKEMGIIAEIKKASPSLGIIRKKFDPIELALEYEKADIDCISVLTDKRFFKGDEGHIKLVKGHTTKPILRKDFILDQYQIYQSKLLGADAILLIASVLDKKELRAFLNTAREIGLYSLVEINNRSELETVLELDGEIIGINNRSLKTFETNIENTNKLMEYIPKGKIVISESGIKNRQDIIHLEQLGVSGVLIGEGFMKSNDIYKKTRELRGFYG